MSTTCESLSAFVDGELPAAEAEAFRDHLWRCEACSSGLEDELLFEAIEAEVRPLLDRHGGGELRAISSARRRPLSRRLTLAALVPALAAAAWAVVGLRHKPGSLEGAAGVAPRLESAEARTTEVRLAYAAADIYRPYDVPRAGGERRREDVPFGSLAALEGKGDLHGMAAGLVLAGDDARAAAYLAKAPQSLDVEADRAAVLLDRGEAAAALTALDAVLSKAPRHPQALFNRALALRDLEAPLAAAEAFDMVAALGEKGWSDEAKQRAEGLRAEHARRGSAWRRGQEAARAMVAGGPVLGDDVVEATPDLARHYLYHSVRAATSSARLAELRPLARKLDERAGGRVLTELVERAARDDFAWRAPLATTYARVFQAADAGRPALDPAAAKAYLGALRARGASDILFGALLLLHEDGANLRELEQIAAASGDPWLIAVAASSRATQQLAQEDYAGAEETARSALEACADKHVEWRRARLEESLAWVLAVQARATELRRVARAGLARSRAFALEREPFFLDRLADAERFDGQTSALEAYAHELELVSPDDCNAKQAAELQIATARVVRLDVAGAVQALDSTSRCERPVTLIEADALVDAVRMGGEPAAARTLGADLAGARESLSPGDRAYADVLSARLLAVTDRAAGDAAARRALDEASSLPQSEPTARRARAYARLTLAVGAAQAGRADEALASIAAGALDGAEPTLQGCALGIAIDDDLDVTVTRGSDGHAAVDVSRRLDPGVSAASLLSSGAATRLAGCTEVAVYAMAPLHGLPRVLPPEVAWSYRSSDLPDERPPATVVRRVVVSDPMPPSALGLPRLGSWGPPAEDVTWIHGRAATPSAVLSEVADATEIEIHGHGTVEAAQSSGAVIALSPDAKGKYALTAADLHPGMLRARPVVVLGACGAARTPAAYYRESWSLPSAFVRAGARAVLASPEAVADAEARPFFDAILARIRGGSPPAVALRDERVAWLARDPKSWVADVIDFE